MSKVLIVEDQAAVVKALTVLFEIHGIPCAVAAGPEEALAAIARGDVGVVVQDMNFRPGETSGEEGMDLFRRVRHADPTLPVLVLTAWTSLETAVQMVKDGASDYLTSLKTLTEYGKSLNTKAVALAVLEGHSIELQAHKLMEALSYTIATLENPQALVPALEAMGRRHVTYGARNGHYDTVIRALLLTLDETLAGRFSPAVREAWNEALTFVADTMKRGAAQSALTSF